MCKRSCVSFAPTAVRLAWRRIVLRETCVFPKSPSVVSHRPLRYPLLCHPPPLSSHSSSSASTSAFHPLNFITFRQKGIYIATKVIAALMEWASCAIDSFKLFWLFSAHMQWFVVRSAPSYVPADPRSLGSFPSKCSNDCVHVCVFFCFFFNGSEFREPWRHLVMSLRELERVGRINWRKVKEDIGPPLVKRWVKRYFL